MVATNRSARPGVRVSPRCGELRLRHAVEQHHGLAERQGAFVDRLQRAGGVERVAVDQHFDEALADVVHRRVEHDPAVADEHHVGEDVLDSPRPGGW